MADIGKLAVVLSAKTDQFTGPLDRAAACAATFGNSFNGIGGAISGAMSKATAGVESFNAALKANPIGAVVALALELKAALSGLASSLKGMFEEGMRSASAQRGLARSLGSTLEGAAGVQFAARSAGVGTDELRTGIGHLERLLGEAASGSRQAQDAFENLGLSWRELAEMDGAAMFGRVNDAIQNQGSAALRASAAQSIYGRGWQSMSGMIRRGSEGIRDGTEQMRAFGAVLSQTDSQAIRTASRSIDRTGAMASAASQGITQSLAAAFAPTVTAIQGAIQKVLEYLQPVFQVVRDIFRWLGKAADAVIAFARPIWDAVKPAFDAVFDAIKSVWNAIKQAIGSGDDWAETARKLGQFFASVIKPAVEAIALIVRNMGEGLRFVIENLPGGGRDPAADRDRQALDAATARNQRILDMANAIRAEERAIRQQIDTMGEATGAAQLWDLAQRGATERQLRGLRELIDTLRTVQADRQAAQIVLNLQRQADTFGMSAREAEEWALRQSGATERTINDLRSAYTWLDRLHREQADANAEMRIFQETLDRIGRLSEQFTDPLERFRYEMQRLLRDLDEQGLGMDVAGRAAESYLHTLEQAAGVSREIRLPGLAEQGSTAAVEAINRFRTGDQGQTVQERIARATEALREQNARTNQLLDEIRRAAADRPQIAGEP